MDLLDLFAKIGIDTTEYEQGLTDAGKKANGLGDKIKTAMKVGAAAVAAVTTATVALTKSFVQSAGEVASYGDNIDKMSQKMGLSATAYQEWDAIMQHSGTSIESLQAGMKTLANAVESGNDAFNRLGITQDDIASMNQEQLFSATISALQNVENETERTYLAGQLLGRGATELGALLNTSAEDTEAMRQRVHELGGVMSDEAVKAAAAYQDTLQDMQTAFAGLKRGLTADFMPAISTVMAGLTEIFAGNNEQGIAMISDGVDSVISDLTDKLPKFIDTSAQIIDAIVTAIIDNLPKILEMGAKLLGELIAGIIQHIPQLIASVPQIVKAIIDGLVAGFPSIVNAGRDVVQMVGDGIASAIDAAKKWGSDLIQNFLDGIKQKWQALKDGIANVANTVKSFLGFSEPDEGPLSDFHTYAPDMMELFAKGIKDNAGLLKNAFDQSLDFSVPYAPTTTSGGGYGNGGGYERVDSGNKELVINIVDEIDGVAFARKTFRYIVDEGFRLGTPIVEG